MVHVYIVQAGLALCHGYIPVKVAQMGHKIPI